MKPLSAIMCKQIGIDQKVQLATYFTELSTMPSQNKPIQFFYWPTPNGWKISIMLEELGVPYNVNYLNIGKGEQFEPDFLAISPNNRMPAIIDPEGPDGEPISVFESGAILMYLGRKFQRFYPTDERKRVAVDEWLMWQISGLGPMSGQAGYFAVYANEKIPYAIDRYTKEVRRLYGVMNKRLEGQEYLADNYSIADIASIGWVSKYDAYGIDLLEYPNLKRWLRTMRERPAVQRGLELGREMKNDLSHDQEAQKILFGQQENK